MSEEDMNYFASPPLDDAPIVLGPPPDDPFGGGGEVGGFSDFSGYAPPPTGDFTAGDVGDFAGGDAFGFGASGSGDGDAGYAGDAAYLGDVNEAPPIILGGPPVDSPPDAPTSDEAIVSTEPSPMQIWNEEWQELLKQRKDEENNRKAELLEQAKIALEQFHAEREQRREAAMAKNREDEQVKLEAIEADLENDNSWQRVCKMIELSHDNSADAKDVKRMRDILILLKNDTAKATTLAA